PGFSPRLPKTIFNELLYSNAFSLNLVLLLIICRRPRSFAAFISNSGQKFSKYPFPEPVERVGC
ncbi:MAG TPA: hypothetical protein PLK28_19095, partial [Candidatus Rifleibacterium sp.]|nr:hypothetical protein [Candidatus Rifleibacterium sp.]